ncbi:MAG: response regulator [Ignavibacteriales bacterium]|nr:response regulator [Ignavibacteriales bacterium]
MDIALPVIDGVKAFKAIRMLPHLAHVPVVVLTASAMTEDRETILAHGFDAFIAKPIEEDILFKTINALLYGE